MYTKSFSIVVNPVGSKFAKALQTSLRNKVFNKVFRRRRDKANRLGFHVTTNPLNKIQQFQKFQEHGVCCPAWTSDATKIAELNSKTVFARTLINSTNGRGIVPFDSGAEVPRAPLYTAYIPKKAEYRVHIMGDHVVDVQEKRMKKDFNKDNRDVKVRNLHNGYVYCRDNIKVTDAMTEQAKLATKACGYFYGAVDIIYNEKQNKYYVLEVNSRPGLMGTTLEKYTECIINHFNLWKK